MTTSAVATGCLNVPVTLDDAKPIERAGIAQLPSVANSQRAATVTVVRDKGYAGSLMTALVTLDGKLLARFHPREILTFKIEPGEHVLGVEGAGSILHETGLNAKSGEHYRYRITFGLEGLILQRSYAAGR